MKILGICLLLVSGSIQTAWAQLRIQRFTVDPIAGLSFSTRPEIMLGPTFCLAGNLTIETTNGWLLGLGGGRTDFRNAVDRSKTGFFTLGYLRYDHSFYDAKIGKAIRLGSAGGKIILEVGAGALRIDTPYRAGTALIGGAYYDSFTNYFLNIPVQINFKYPFTQGASTCFLASVRWNLNKYHSFPLVGIGVSVNLWESKRGMKNLKYPDTTR